MNTRILLNSLLAVISLGLFASCAPTKSSHSIESNAQQAGILKGVESTIDFQRENGIVGIYLMLEDSKGNQGGATCTGTLIRSNVVLTAAHCLAASGDMKLKGAIVFFTTDFKTVEAELQKRDFSNVRATEKLTVHEAYNPSEQATGITHDVGLIRLKGDAPAGFKVANLPTADLAKLLVKDTALTLSGFGLSKYNKNEKSGQLVGSGSGLLRQVSGVKFVESDETGHEMMLDQSNGGACHGDSGGPAFYTDTTDAAAPKTYLVGVTSRGEEPCTTYSIYSSTIGYSDWIQANVEAILK